jgi:sulfonate transport system permease protein
MSDTATCPGPLALEGEPPKAEVSEFTRNPEFLELSSVEDPTGKRRIKKRRRVPPWLRRLSGPALLLALWQCVTGLHLVSSEALSSPGAVISAAHQLWLTGVLQSDLIVSLYRVGWGLLIGVSIGLGVAVVAGFFRIGEDLIDSSMNMLRMVPVIALLPLIIIWIGIGEGAKVFLVALGSVFPIYMNTFSAIRGIDQKLIEAGRAFGLGRLGLIRRVLVPGALPGFLVGLRWALGGSWLLLFFAETVNASSGIGYLITQAESLSQTNVIILGVVLYGLLGLLGDIAVRLLERTLLGWRRGFEGT